jgi:hypothetical protein
VPTGALGGVHAPGVPGVETRLWLDDPSAGWFL